MEIAECNIYYSVMERPQSQRKIVVSVKLFDSSAACARPTLQNLHAFR